MPPNAAPPPGFVWTDTAANYGLVITFTDVADMSINMPRLEGYSFNLFLGDENEAITKTYRDRVYRSIRKHRKKNG